MDDARIHEIREAVRLLALARGWLNTSGRGWDVLPPWIVHFPPSPLVHITIASFAEAAGWKVEPITALLWSLLAWADFPPVDVGICAACAGLKTTHWGTDPEREGPAPWKAWEGRLPGSGPDWCSSRPCVECHGADGLPTGRDLRSPALLLLEGGHQDELTVLADRWECEGAPRGRWLVSWLMGWPGDSAEVCGAAMVEEALLQLAYRADRANGSGK